MLHILGLKRNRDEDTGTGSPAAREERKEDDPSARRNKPMRVLESGGESSGAGNSNNNNNNDDDDDDDDEIGEFDDWYRKQEESYRTRSGSGSGTGSGTSYVPEEKMDKYHAWRLREEVMSDMGSIDDDTRRDQMSEAGDEEDAERERQMRIYQRVLGNNRGRTVNFTSANSAPGGSGSGGVEFAPTGAPVGLAGYTDDTLQRSLPERIHKTAAAVSKRTIEKYVREGIEKAHADPRYRNLKTYASHLGITMDKLLEAPPETLIRRAVRSHPDLKVFMDASLEKSFLDARTDVEEDWNNEVHTFINTVCPNCTRDKKREILKALKDQRKDAARIAEQREMRNVRNNTLASLVTGTTVSSDDMVDVIATIISNEPDEDLKRAIRSSTFVQYVYRFLQLTVDIRKLREYWDTAVVDRNARKEQRKNVHRLKMSQRFVTATAFEDELRAIPEMRGIYIVAEPYAGGLMDMKSAVEAYMRTNTPYSPALATVSNPLADGIEWILRIPDSVLMSTLLLYAAMSVSVQKSIQGKVWINLDAQALNTSNVRNRLYRLMMRPDYRNLVKQYSDAARSAEVARASKGGTSIVPRAAVANLIARSSARTQAERMAQRLSAHLSSHR